MDLFEESRDDRLIEDYLFSGYKPHNQKSTFDADQQFARPIEDEDLFCVKDDTCYGNKDDIIPIIEPVDTILEPSTNQFDFDDRPFRRLSDEPLVDTNASSPGKLFEDEASDPLSPPNVQQNDILPDAPVDDIFLDDYSESGDGANNENIRPTLEKSYSKPANAAQLTPAQIKKKLTMERFKQQALAMQQNRPKPRGIGTGLSKEDTIELSLEGSKLVSDSSSKLIFNRLFNQSKKAGSPNCNKLSWDSHKAMLRKQICTQKRKVWDSFQAPVDGYDEEEELIGAESIGGSEKDVEEVEDDPDEQEQPGSDVDGGSSNGDSRDDNVESGAPSEDEADIDESDLDDQDEADSEGNQSEMDCTEESRAEYKSDKDESEGDDEIVRRRIRIHDDTDDEDGSVRKFIDDEVEVEEDLY